ncbi:MULTISPECIES: hypothetical protein [Pseudomonas]|uniref:hypothetical protein n=1 Tax=Pseudomonas TaxID=286 RepID=UPI000CF6E996|nr:MULTISPECIES: hypothetical protein [Pseudomonas]AVJ40205.1 hypothetical protein CLM75_23790 [Pseudomonas lurida]PRA14325.1 hypothetical protein CQ002_21705 [Pseudomonas sp. MYb13]PRA18106.1 hypothetical protein CQ004_23535 [Pseudomonas lurida]PRA31008.1 hypothetical protein CQ005_21770 [Pseudomonas lurida]PRB97160.1 hypothetical protein CQ014_22130 [Pseudomonas lurida]
MYRDKAIAKQILLWMEANTPAFGSQEIVIREGALGANADLPVFSYHMEILVSGGYLTKVKSEVSGFYQLTWKGHDLIPTL